MAKEKKENKVKKNNPKSQKKLDLQQKKGETKEVKHNQLKMAIVGQYLKDLSFENPNAPDIFKEKNPPKVEVDVNVKVAKSTLENIYESSLQLRVTLKQGYKVSFVIEVEYTGIVEVICDDEEAVKVVLVTEVPKLLFPYVRQLVSSTSVQGGFPPLNLAPINFEVQKNKH